MKWISAFQLEEWARRTTARLDLPCVVGNLIRASCADITSFRFPSGEKGQVRGFDGHLITSGPGFNVPKGSSFWEFSTRQDFKTKAKCEFSRVSALVSRNIREDSTFVYVTPWTWDSSSLDNTLENWENEQRSEASWKDVIFIDGAKLEAWLANCPAVAAWHARKTFKEMPQDGARSTDDFWEYYINQFSPQLTEQVLLCERDQEAEKLLKVLMGGPDRISFSADHPDEVIAFAVAAIRSAAPDVRLFLEARTLVVDNLTAGRQLLANDRLVYLLRGETTGSPGLFFSRGPTLVPLGRHQRSGSAQALNRPSGQALGIALRSIGLAETKAMTLARGCGRSLTALMRQIPGGSCQDPPWMPDRESLLPAILVGGWDARNHHDIAILERIIENGSYQKYESKLRGFLNREDPPLEKEGSVWKVRAPMDAFLHVGELIGREHLEALRTAMGTVFGEIRPEPDPRAVVRFSEPSATYSEWLRDGLATSLLLIAVWQNEARLSLYDGEGQRFANELIDSLPGLSADHRLLASLRDELPLLAEAAPLPLLSALERMLEGDGALIRPIFIETEGFLVPTADHTGLLWALETVAWDPEYFDRTIKILARLAAIDPGGKIANRPINSLREIFVLWSPNTNAPLEQRLAIIDWICGEVPDVAWPLLCALLPSPHDSSTPTARPRLRDAGASDRAAVTYEELWASQSAIIERAVKLAGHSAARWERMVGSMSNFSAQDQLFVLNALSLALEHMPEQDRQSLWRGIRSEVEKHERFSSAAWALPPDQLRPLRELRDRYAPSDPIGDAVWLFDTWIQDAYDDEKRATQRRVDALRQVLSDQGLEGVLRLGLETKHPYEVARMLEDAPCTRRDIEELFKLVVRSDEDSAFALGLSHLLYRAAGEDVAMAWIEQTMRSVGWTPACVARLLLPWPMKTSTWHFVRRLGDDVEGAYWRAVDIGPIDGSKFDFLKAIETFLRYKRGLPALRMAYHRLKDAPTRLLLRILDAVIESLNAGSTSALATTQWEIERVFTELDRRGDATDDDVAKREFALFSALEHGNRPLRLHKVMSTNPEFYHDIICRVFRPKDDSSLNDDLSEGEATRARIFYSLLSKFTYLPGCSGADVDASALSRWIDRVRELALASDRIEIADIYIGHLLAHAAEDADGVWPHRAVRDQIERLKSDELERGIQTERFNMRGAHWIDPYAGGVEERAFAERNRDYALKAARWSRTAAMLRRIAESWDAFARHQDTEAAQRKLKS